MSHEAGERAGRPVAILGVGRAGLTLALALRHWGRAPSVLWDRGSKRAEALARQHGLEVLQGPPPEALPRTGIWLLAVPDCSIIPLAQELAASGLARAGPVVLHLCGALDSSALEALAERGAQVGSMHPLSTLPDLIGLTPARAEEQAVELLAGSTFGIEGQSMAALDAAEWLVRGWGGRSIRLRPSGKAAYHAGAVMASNAIVALLFEASELVGQGLEEPAEALDLLLGLARGALDQVAAMGCGPALTGPVRRGDVETVTRHLEALADDPHAQELYRCLGRSTLRLARQAGAAQERLAALQELLGPTLC